MGSLTGSSGAQLSQSFWDTIYGVAGVDLGALTVNYIGSASGMVWGGNPCFTLQDFCSIYQKFFGSPTAITGAIANAPIVTQAAITQDSELITLVDPTLAANIQVGFTVFSGLSLIPDNTTVSAVNTATGVITLSANASTNGTVYLSFADPVKSYQIANVIGVSTIPMGTLITGAGIAGDAVVTSIDGNGTLTLSAQTTQNVSSGSFNLFLAPVMPIAVIQMFINLALSSVMQARWCELWKMGVALYVAHYSTLWLRSEAGPNSTAAQIVQSGMQVGLLTSKSAGSVSAGIELVKGFLENWGDYNLTLYGIQFATHANAIGGGPIWVGSGGGRSPGLF